MDEIMNKGPKDPFEFWNSTNPTIDVTGATTTWIPSQVNTSSTAGTYNLSTDTGGTWFPYYNESTWVPYVETDYIPKWHIAQGYKIQIKSMWD